MEKLFPTRLDLGLVIATVLAGVAYLLAGPLPESLALGFFIALMVLTGIPHGATDHVLFLHSQKAQGLSFSWSRFLAPYLLAMLTYGLLWYWQPMLSLGLFLLLSAHHFGQSQLLFLRLPESQVLKHLLYLAWGGLLLYAVIVFNWQESAPVLADILAPQSWGESMWVRQSRSIVLAGFIGWALAFAALAKSDKIDIADALRETLNLALLLLLFGITPLLVGFAVYFGLWHSLRSIYLEIQGIRQDSPGFQLSDFIRQALPFSLLSFVGIGLLLGLNAWLGAVINPFLLFFILISVLTLPHSFFIHRFYAGPAMRRAHSGS